MALTYPYDATAVATGGPVGERGGRSESMDEVGGEAELESGSQARGVATTIRRCERASRRRWS